MFKIVRIFANGIQEVGTGQISHLLARPYLPQTEEQMQEQIMIEHINKSIAVIADEAAKVEQAKALQCAFAGTQVSPIFDKFVEYVVKGCEYTGEKIDYTSLNKHVPALMKSIITTYWFVMLSIRITPTDRTVEPVTAQGFVCNTLEEIVDGSIVRIHTENKSKLPFFLSDEFKYMFQSEEDAKQLADLLNFEAKRQYKQRKKSWVSTGQIKDVQETYSVCKVSMYYHDSGFRK